MTVVSDETLTILAMEEDLSNSDGDRIRHALCSECAFARGGAPKEGETYTTLCGIQDVWTTDGSMLGEEKCETCRTIPNCAVCGAMLI